MSLTEKSFAGSIAGMSPQYLRVIDEWGALIERPEYLAAWERAHPSAAMVKKFSGAILKETQRDRNRRWVSSIFWNKPAQDGVSFMPPIGLYEIAKTRGCIVASHLGIPLNMSCQVAASKHALAVDPGVKALAGRGMGVRHHAYFDDYAAAFVMAGLSGRISLFIANWDAIKILPDGIQVPENELWVIE